MGVGFSDGERSGTALSTLLLLFSLFSSSLSKDLTKSCSFLA